MRYPHQKAVRLGCLFSCMLGVSMVLIMGLSSSQPSPMAAWKQQSFIGCNGRFSPRFGHKLPVVVGFWCYCTFCVDVIHNDLALVFTTHPHNAPWKFFEGNARTACQQLASTIAAIAIHCHTIALIEHERSPIAQPKDVDFPPNRLPHIDFIINAGHRVEIKC